jgi:tripartite-type tricarboxylate transporter receptor subunit TctC
MFQAAAFAAALTMLSSFAAASLSASHHHDGQLPFATGGPCRRRRPDPRRRDVEKTLGQTVVIENKLGAGGTIAANHVASPPRRLHHLHPPQRNGDGVRSTGSSRTTR